MTKKLFVGNLSFNATEEGLRTLFSQYGDVTSVTLINDRETGRARGFGFVEMENADAAIAALNEKDYEGKTLNVNVARERSARNDSSDFHNRNGGGGNRSNRQRRPW